MRIYLDGNYLCHTSDGDAMRAVETDAFDGKCIGYIEGYRLIPEGEAWTRKDGQVFTGRMLAPAKDSRLLEAMQAAYDEAMNLKEAEAEDMRHALEVLGVQP